jgi:hypothetical protein
MLKPDVSSTFSFTKNVLRPELIPVRKRCLYVAKGCFMQQGSRFICQVNVKLGSDSVGEVWIWVLTGVSLALALFPWISYVYYERKERSKKC